MIGWIFVVGVPILLAFVALRVAKSGAGAPARTLVPLSALAVFGLVAAFGPRAHGADDLPPLARVYIPTLMEEIAARWPEVPHRSALGAQVEQETCITLRSSRCWSPHAELKTAREYGFGLGQLTITSRFSTFEEVRGLDPGLAEWKWEDRLDPRMQLRALVVKDRHNWRGFRAAASALDRLAFALAAYNGGVGGIMADVRLCTATPECDSGRWFGHVERTSLKSRIKATGYGKSFFEINREYVRNVLLVRRPRYVDAMEGGA